LLRLKESQLMQPKTRKGKQQWMLEEDFKKRRQPVGRGGGGDCKHPTQSLPKDPLH